MESKLEIKCNMIKVENKKYVAPMVMLGQMNVLCSTLLCASKDPIYPNVGTEDYDDGDNYGNDLFD